MNQRCLIQALLLCTISWVSYAQAQRLTAHEVKGLDTIRRPAVADRLPVRVEQLLSAYRVRDWEGVYKLLSAYPPPELLTDFVAEMKRQFPPASKARYLAFTIHEIQQAEVDMPVPQWNMFGCLNESDERGRKKRVLGMVIASWEKGEWYFSRLTEVSAMHGRTAFKCQQ